MTDCGLSPDSLFMDDKRTPVDRAIHVFEILIGSILHKKDPVVFGKPFHPVRFAPIRHLLYSQQYTLPHIGILLTKVCEINAMPEGFAFS